jgi:hypothetical protein
LTGDLLISFMTGGRLIWAGGDCGFFIGLMSFFGGGGYGFFFGSSFFGF